ncbi:MAG: hypothetical protein HWE22_20495 [Flavobacteriales bacterium]|nr:hypothetical protein [Flavobacteriales bacterium]
MFIVLEKFLKLNNFSRVISDFKDYYQSHPNFPSLFALTDTLSLLNIENVAARVDKDHFHDLPDSFLGYVEEEGKGPSLALVRKSAQSVEVLFEKKKPKRLSIEEFIKCWNGIVVAIEPGTNDDASNTISKSSLVLVVTLLCVSGFTLINNSVFSWSYLFNYALYVFGAIVSVAILREKYSSDPNHVSKICSLGTNTSCSSVIKSERAEFTKWIGFSDLGVVFFGASLLTLLLEPDAMGILNSISLFSLPVIIYSIWVQRVVLKSWCVLCLMLAVTLLAQSIWALYTGINVQVGVVELVFSLIFMLVIWLFVKKHLDTFDHLKSSNKELLRFKREFEIFKFLQKPLPLETSVISNGKISIGPSDNPVKMSLVISPSCFHCDKAYKDALQLLEENPKRISLEIFYNLNPENQDNPYLKIARSILQLSEVEPEKCIAALSEWHLGDKDLDLWLKKWGQEDDEKADRLLAEQYRWCLQNEFNYTPVKIINDCELSMHYSLDELKYFIAELSEPEEM